MTGFGEATVQAAGFVVSVEIRTLNNRFLKIIPSLSEGFTNLAPRVEQVLRQRLRRGTVHVYVRIRRLVERPRWRINTETLEAYKFQLEVLKARWGFAEPLRLETLLSLPGVIEAENGEEPAADSAWPVIEQALSLALEQVEKSRQQEGAATQASLQELCSQGLQLVDRIEAQAPLTVASYRQRFEERLRQLLSAASLAAGEVDVLREVAAFADRVDIGEEIVRLRGHFRQFLSLMGQPDCSGRQLDFLAQEMHREASTIGAKASDGQIAHWIVEMKTLVERIREIVQNLE